MNQLSWFANEPAAIMKYYVDSTEQLVTEIFVKNIRVSVSFYQRLGFQLLRDGGDFVELTWEEHRLFLAEISAVHDAELKPTDLHSSGIYPVANVRVMVADVDSYWSMVQQMGARVILPIADRYYGLRDFTIADPDGFGVRFASRLNDGV
jgi:catechol 2,3-dioxygenase-like lactoylglutathione lyase family enzyme